MITNDIEMHYVLALDGRTSNKREKRRWLLPVLFCLMCQYNIISNVRTPKPFFHVHAKGNYPCTHPMNPKFNHSDAGTHSLPFLMTNKHLPINPDESTMH